MKVFKVVLSISFFSFLFLNSSFGQNASTKILPDLIITKIKLASVPAHKRTYSGNKIRVPVEITVRNIGKKSLSRRARLSLMLQTRFEIEFVPVYGGLRVGQSKKVKAYILVRKSDMLRNVKFTATADIDKTSDDVYTGHIKEISERNNSRSTFLRIPRYYFKPTINGGQVAKVSGF
jgi:hypothetical protein